MNERKLQAERDAVIALCHESYIPEGIDINNI